MNAAAAIEVTRGALVSRSPGNRRPISNYYECTGPDGRKFTNTSIVTLRDVLRRRYGRDVVIVETWKVPAVENPCDVCGAEFGTGDCDDCADKRAADARGAAGWS